MLMVNLMVNLIHNAIYCRICVRVNKQQMCSNNSNFWKIWNQVKNLGLPISLSNAELSYAASHHLNVEVFPPTCSVLWLFSGSLS